jgi:DNA-binding transcriptional ArsR family regulator
MADGPNIVRIAALIGDRARSEILTSLLGDQALMATELASMVNLTKQTTSAHLAKLLGARLIAVQSQGRHRYFRLADPDVARLLEDLMGVAQRTGAVRLRSSPRDPALRKARVCYDHLAGDLGVLMLEGLQRRRVLQRRQGALTVTRAGIEFLNDIGIDIDALASQRRTLCRTCLDWSVRRDHLAGSLGATLLPWIYQQGWARHARGSRVVSFTTAGEAALMHTFG